MKKSKFKDFDLGDRIVYNVYTLFPNEVVAIKKLWFYPRISGIFLLPDVAKSDSMTEMIKVVIVGVCVHIFNEKHQILFDSKW